MKNLFKRMAALLLAAALVIGFFPAVSRAETTATEISSLEEITDLSGSYILTADVTATAPIGSESTPFTGSFDGNGHTVTVNITATGNYTGLFAVIGEGATVTNFKIANSTVATTGNYSYLGLVAGVCYGTVSNVVVENGTVQGYAYVGGLVGLLESTGIITACAVESGSIEKTVEYGSDSYYGGIVGDNKGAISLSSNGATVANNAGSSNRGYFGGIAGRNTGTITDCYNFGAIDTSATKAYRTAGIAGYNDAPGAVENCHNVGAITVESTTVTTAKAAIACLKTWGTVGTTTNCFYLDTCGVTDTKATSKTALEFEALAATLGGSWTDGDSDYPVLSWQTWKYGTTTEPVEGAYTIEHYTENLDSEGYTLATTTAGDTPAGETATAEATELEGFTYDEANENNITSGTVTEDGSLVLKLYYSRNSYTLAWDVADGTITSEEGSYTAGSVKYEAPITAPTATAEGRDFAGWSPSIETMPAQDVTISAVWSAKLYDVNWDPNGGTLDTVLWTGEYGATAGAKYGEPLNKYTYSADRPTWIFTRNLPDPEHETMVFDGWYTAAEGGELVTGDMIVTEPEGGTFTFYAHWLEAYTVTLDPGEGKLSNNTFLVAKNQAFGTAVGTMPVAAQYDYHHFNAWIKDGEELTLDTIITADVTYYATWNPNTAKVVFYANGGEGEMAEQIITYGEDQPLTKCAFTRDGYVFLGWATSSSATEATIADEATGVTDPTYNGRIYRLYAIWAECEHTMDYVDNGDGTHDYVCSDCGTVEIDNEAHSYTDGTCACGAEEGPVEAADLVLYRKTLSLQSYIAFNLTVKNEVLADYDSWYVVFERYDHLSGATVTETVEGELYNTSYQLFEYKVSSYQMTDDITATLYAVKDGVTYKGEVYTDSIENFVASRMEAAAASSADMATLYANLLTYGSKAQTYLGYNTAALADANLGDYASYVTTTAPTAEDLSAETSNGLTGATKDRLALGIAASVQIQLRIVLDSAYDVNNVYGVLSYERNGEAITQRIEGADFTVSGSKYILIFDAITAVDGRAPVSITIYDANGTAISETWTYSISSYLVSGGLEGNALATMEALLNYFDAAAKVFS